MTDSIAALFADARARLAQAPTEALGELSLGRRILGLSRAPRIVPRGRAWHLGVLLLTPDAVLATGDIVSSHEEVRRGFTAESQRRRAELAAAAFRGGFAEGTPVHFGWRAVDLDAIGATGGPLVTQDGAFGVRWSAAGAIAPLAGYLDDRIDLLLRSAGGAPATD